MRSYPLTFPVLVFLSALPVLYLLGQSPAPQTYSVSTISMMTTASMFTGRAADVKIFRRGPKELVEATIAPWEANPKGVHTIDLFDLQEHRVYMRNVVDKTCSWMRYVSAEVPAYDPIGVSAKSIAESAGQTPKVVGRESVNGIPARIEEVPGPPEQGKVRVWMAEKGDFLVKSEMTRPDGQTVTLLEVKQVSFTEPSASLFTAPSNCDTQAEGEMSSTGFSGHAEASIEAHGTGSVDLKTNATQGEATVRTSGMAGSQSNPRPAPARSAGLGATEPNAPSRVTEVRLHLVPDHYAGPCPGHVQLVGEITTNGPGTVWYRFLAGAVSHSPEGTVTFSEAGTKTVAVEGTFRATPRVPSAALLAIMEDQAGNHGPLTLSSGPADYNIVCTGQAPPAN